MKNHLIVALAMMVLVTNAWDLRFLQGWSDPNCAQWSKDGQTCLKCIPRSYNNTQQNKCIRVDDNCKTWSETNGECVTCYDSYGDAWKNGNAINGKCPYYNGPQTDNTTQTQNNTLPENNTQPENNNLPENQTVSSIGGGETFVYDQNCKCYTDDKVCIECYQDYELDSQGVCQPKPAVVIPNCKTVTNGACAECETGYYLDQSGNCVELPANCTTVDSTGSCTECVSGFVLTSSSICVEQIANCTQYTAEGMCQTCESSFYIDAQGMCVLLSANCLSADQTGACTACEPGYTIDVEGTCELMPQNCNMTDANGICTECNIGFYLDQQMVCQTLPENCTEANALGKCTQCQNDLVVFNGECVAIAGPNPNCAQQNTIGECTKCRRFYELKNGDCVLTGQNPFCKPGSCQCGTGKCLECKKGYFLDVNGICIAIPQNCKQYSSVDGTCTTCENKFSLSDGQCIPAEKPIGSVNLNCKTQDGNGTCTECRKYYKLIDGQCAPLNKNPKCQIWNKEKVCECCYYPDKYYLDNNNICSEKKPNCAQIDMQDGSCTKCEKGYKLKDGQCVSSS